MRYYFLLLTFLSFSLKAQNAEEIISELSKVYSLPEANEFLNSNKDVVGDILTINSGSDTTALDQELLLTQKGDVVEFDSEDKTKHFIFKTLGITHVRSFRVQYIFLDNRRLPMEEIDSLRTLILEQLSNGEPFTALAKRYSMDSNATKGGDLGWFEEGQMHADFENSIKSKKVNEVFTVDIPANKWYYVVKNSYESRIDKKVTLLYVEINNQKR